MIKKIILYPFNQGQQKMGVSNTPNVFNKYLQKCILKKEFVDILDLNENGNYCHKYDPLCHNIYSVMYNSEQLYKINKKNLAQKIININIGGDHSMALGTVSASINKYKHNLKVLWIDAHADINTPYTSSSGNLHGMPLSYLLMNRNKIFGEWLYDNRLKPEQLIYIGLRDVDDGEREILENMNIKYYTPAYVKNMGIDYIIQKEKLLQYNIHLSLDVDGIDPKYFPSTGTPVKDGLELDDVKFLCSYLKNNIVNCDLTELNFDIGNNEDKRISYYNSLELLDILIN